MAVRTQDLEQRAGFFRMLLNPAIGPHPTALAALAVRLAVFMPISVLMVKVQPVENVIAAMGAGNLPTPCDYFKCLQLSEPIAGLWHPTWKVRSHLRLVFSTPNRT